MCEAVVAEIDMTGTLQARTTATVGVWLTEGEEPFEAPRVELIFARVGHGTVLRFPAEPSTLEGRYVAQVELPAGGTWTIATEFQGSGDGSAFSLPLVAMQVTDAPATPVSGPSSAAAAPSAVAVPTWGWLLGSAALLAGIGGLAAVGRRRLVAA